MVFVRQARVGRTAVQKLWLRVHVWMGLCLGLLFVFAGLTGSVLVFHRAIDAWLNPSLLMPAEPRDAHPLNELLASLRAATPDLPAPAYLDLPQTKADVVHAWYRMRGESAQADRKLEVLLDPGTGEVLGRREYGTHVMSMIYGLHREWLCGNPGETAVGIVGITLVLSISTGVYLWWPKPGQFRRAFQRGRKPSVLQQHYYRHKMAGLSGALGLVLIASSGIFIEFHEWLTSVISLISPVHDGEPSVSSRVSPGVTPISAQQAMSLARKQFPEADITYLMLPDGPAGVYMVGVREPDEALKTGGSSGIWIDQYSGDLLAVRDWARFTAGETFVAWMFPLHNGEAFGLPGRVVVCLSGLVPLVLYGTAVRMWWLKRHANSCRRLSPGSRLSSTATSS